MRKRTMISLAGSLLTVGGVAAGGAQAAVSFSYVTDALSYSAAQASQVAVQIYLKETLTAGSTDIVAGDGGLAGAGAGLNFTGVTGGTASTVANGTFTPASSLAPTTHSLYYNQPTNANNLEFVELAGDTGPFPSPPTNGLLLLGTIDIKVGSGTSTFALTSLNNDTIDDSNSNLGQEDGNTVTVNSTDLDKTGQSGFTGADAAALYTFTVSPTVMPEPGSISLLGLGALGLLTRRRKTV